MAKTYIVRQDPLPKSSKQKAPTAEYKFFIHCIKFITPYMRKAHVKAYRNRQKSSSALDDVNKKMTPVKNKKYITKQQFTDKTINLLPEISNECS